VTRVPTHISPSQIASARQCVRRWWYEKVHGITSPGTPATHFGSVLHAVVEGYLLQLNEAGLAKHIKETVADATAAEITKAKTLLAGAIPAAVLPRPGTGEVEREMLIPFEPMPGGLKGRLDFVDLERETPLVLDHKTTSDPAYAKTEETLLQDPQVILYAYWALLQRPEAKHIAVRYVYYLTKGAPRVWAVDIMLTSDKVRESFDWLSQEIRGMINHFGCSEAADVPFKLSACNSFGRPCPAMGQCPAHAKPSAKQGIDKLRALAQSSALSSSSTTGVAQYATITKESSMTAAAPAQIKIALNNFRRNAEAFGIGVAVVDKLQEDVFADMSMVGLPDDVADVVKQVPSLNPTTNTTKILQWLVSESRRRIAAETSAAAALSAATATPVGGLFQDVVLSDEQEEYKQALVDLGYPETTAIQMVTMEAARAEDIINNEIRYTGDDTDDEDGEIAAEEPAPAASPLAGRARATVVSTPAPAAAAPAEPAEPTKAYAKVIASLKGAGAATSAIRSAYEKLEGDDLTTVDAWLAARAAQVGKGSLAEFLDALCAGLVASSLSRNSKDIDTLRSVYSEALTSVKDGARVRGIESQLAAIALLFGGSIRSGALDLPFLGSGITDPNPTPRPDAATKAPKAAKPTPEPTAAVAPPEVVEAAPVQAPAPKEASVRTAVSPVPPQAVGVLHVLIDVAVVRGTARNAVMLSDVWMNRILRATDDAGRDPRLDQYGAALKPVAILVAQDIAGMLQIGDDVTLMVESGSASWRLCSDEITAMADLVVRASA
jgi:hypothetical protein